MSVNMFVQFCVKLMCIQLKPVHSSCCSLCGAMIKFMHSEGTLEGRGQELEQVIVPWKPIWCSNLYIYCKSPGPTGDQSMLIVICSPTALKTDTKPQIKVLHPVKGLIVIKCLQVSDHRLSKIYKTHVEESDDQIYRHYHDGCLKNNNNKSLQHNIVFVTSY